MPVADYNTYCRMIDHALEKKFAYPAINVTSLTTANGVLKGLAESKSDGIIQVSTGGAAFASGLYIKDMPLGAISIAEHVHRAAARYPIYVALHTDHCGNDREGRKVSEESPWLYPIIRPKSSVPSGLPRSRPRC
jgi:fructose-bisphosphate aldolase class II